MAASARRADPRAGPDGQPQAGRPTDARGGHPGLYRRRRHGCTVRDPHAEPYIDLVDRDFVVDGPDELWCTDITEHPTLEGKVYCAAVLDADARRIVGWSIGDNMRTELVTDALGMAITRRTPEHYSAILHSDHGSQGGFNQSSQHRFSIVRIVHRGGLRRECSNRVLCGAGC